MKAKRVLIAYLNNGNLQSQVAKEFLFNKVVNDLIAEGRKVNGSAFQQHRKEVSFDDGTKVLAMPFGMSVLGMRFTHLYIDEIAMSTPKGQEAIDAMYKYTIVNGDYMNFDTSEQDRSFTFLFENGAINLKKI